ncbi:MAG TPA: dipeptide epimerase, partial [Chitinophagaceae bacterium]|nr:dipeptide epimerase [Chitinophagaceae bacterium]
MPFEYPFTISGGRTKTHQPALVVALQLGPFIGFGEAPAIAYYDVTVDSMIADIVAKQKMIEKFAFTEPGRYWHYLHHLLPKSPFLVCALDMAAWDLFGKMKGKLLYQLFDTTFEQHIVTDYTIGIDTIDAMVAKMKAKPWPIYKIKLGHSDDIAMVAALRQNTNAVFRVDANAGWTRDEAVVKIPQLAALGVELVEQPLAKDDWEGMAMLKALSPLPLIADESCVFEQDVAKCADYFHGINIKLTKCSGITPALRMIESAKSLGLKVMMGSMNESAIGSAAIAHFIPQLDYVDMDGPLLQTKTNGTGLAIDANGFVRFSGNEGLGVE